MHETYQLNMLKYSNVFYTGICVSNFKFSSVIPLLEAYSVLFNRRWARENSKIKPKLSMTDVRIQLAESRGGVLVSSRGAGPGKERFSRNDLEHAR